MKDRYRSGNRKCCPGIWNLYASMRVRSERPSKPTVSMSVLGRDGGNMYVDRFVEFFNFLLKKRNSSHAAFDMALQFTPHLPALMHAHAVGGSDGG